jgi:hypothetical protein
MEGSFLNYNKEVVERVAQIVTGLTNSTFAYGGDHRDGRHTAFKADTESVVWTGRASAEQATAYYAGAGLRWAELSDTVAKVHDTVLKAANASWTSSPLVREAYQYGRAEAERRHSPYQRQHAHAYVGEARKLLPHTKTEFIAWCGGRTVDDRTSDSVYVKSGGEDLLVEVGQILTCIDKGWYRIHEP